MISDFIIIYTVIAIVLYVCFAHSSCKKVYVRLRLFLLPFETENNIFRYFSVEVSNFSIKGTIYLKPLRVTKEFGHTAAR
jgi:hypothetical protein